MGVATRRCAGRGREKTPPPGRGHEKAPPLLGVAARRYTPSWAWPRKDTPLLGVATVPAWGGRGGRLVCAGCSRHSRLRFGPAGVHVKGLQAAPPPRWRRRFRNRTIPDIVAKPGFLPLGPTRTERNPPRDPAPNAAGPAVVCATVSPSLTHCRTLCAEQKYKRGKILINPNLDSRISKKEKKK